MRVQIIFNIIATLGIVYFLFGKRRFDFFSVAFISACVYFLPGFLGYALDPLTKMQPIELIDETYWVMVTVLLAILFGAIIFDKGVRESNRKVVLRGSKSAVVIATLLGLLGFILTLSTTGSALFLLNKSAIMAELNRWIIIWEIGASLGAVLSFHQLRWGLFSICIVLLLIDVYIGFRSSFALTLISIFTIWLNSKGRQRIAIVSWKAFALALLGALFIFVYKFLYIAIKAGNWEAIKERLGNPLFYLQTVLKSEPFTTQVILNEVIRKDFHVGAEHFMGLINQFMLFSNNMGLKSVSFNDLFQPALFPGVQSGMANNIWAEMWSSGGWFLLIIFIIFFISILFLGSYFLVRISDPVLRSLVVLLFSYWAFYIHRNDILYQINLEKRIFLVWLVCVLVSLLLTGRVRTRSMVVPRMGRCEADEKW